MTRAALLLLADGRFPAGGHAHSGGAEAAVRAGRIDGGAGLEEFCRGRLHTAGLVAASLAAASALGAAPREVDAAADARTPSPALRGVARRLGRQLLRAGRATWPSAELDALGREFPKGAHQPVVLGVVARAAGLGARDAAYCAAYECVSGPATAVVRLLSLDPFEASGVLARLGPEVDRVVDRAVETARGGVDALPAVSGPLLEIGGETHATSTTRLFAS
ncbi:urease accessory UreF family protein [Streptomyces sp. NPDC026672]|uniref:urease accessory protein UreF n=1 Tax=unclassified Streptomyces TaxID=2593676 RepID=UPI0033CD3127